MKSPSILFTLLSCVSTESTASNNHHRSSILTRRRSFTTTKTSTPPSASWSTIPRGGSDGDSSSSASAPDMSSLLSGMNLPGGMPDLSQPPSPDQIAQSMEQFTALLSSPQFKEMLDDPAKMESTLETMRQSLLGALEEMEKGDNPMMKMMMEQMKQQVGAAFPGGWDGLKDLINDADQWKEMMGGLVDVMKSLGEEDLGKLMSQMAGMGGAGGMGGMGGGLPGMGGSMLGDAFGGDGDTTGTLAGLDDLSEGED